MNQVLKTLNIDDDDRFEEGVMEHEEDKIEFEEWPTYEIKKPRVCANGDLEEKKPLNEHIVFSDPE